MISRWMSNSLKLIAIKLLTYADVPIVAMTIATRFTSIVILDIMSVTNAEQNGPDQIYELHTSNSMISTAIGQPSATQTNNMKLSCLYLDSTMFTMP